jgi:hypothetical protein
VAWLRAVALTARARVAQRRDVAAQPVVDRVVGAGGGGERPGQRVVYLEQRARLLGLAARQRQLLGLHGLGLYDGISVLTGASRRTVQRQLLRGRAALRAR